MGDALALETLFVHEDVKDHAEIDEAVASAEVKKPELELAKQIIASLAAPFEPEELRSEYRESLRELLEAKLAGQEFELPGAGGARPGGRPDGGAQGVASPPPRRSSSRPTTRKRRHRASAPPPLPASSPERQCGAGNAPSAWS